MKIGNVPVRRFEVELKHRPVADLTGENETLIYTIQFQVPRLGNSDWEKRWCALCVWNLLGSEEAKLNQINQAFIFSADYAEIIMRLEVNPFEDEVAHKLPPPSEKSHTIWHESVQKRFAQLYGMKLSEWQRKTMRSAWLFHNVWAYHCDSWV